MNLNFYNYRYLKRFLDIFLAVCLSILFLPIFLSISLLIRLTSPGPIIHFSNRIGINNKLFKMPKFRTMYISTPQVATHLLSNPKQHITPIGLILRKLSFDELPQFFSIISGDMSFVGPRPALFNQHDLIELRTNKNIQKIRPGLTGLAQISGRDELSIIEKVSFDENYLHKRSLFLDFKILFFTFFKMIKSKGISH